MDDLGPLLVVQEHDLALDRLRHRRTALPQRAAVAEGDAALRSIQAEASELRGPLGELTRTQDKLEDEAQSLADQAKAADKRLYSGEVSSPKELQALQADVDMLRRHQRQVEERAFAVMEEREPLDAQVSALALRYEAQAGEVNRLRGDLTAAEAAVDAEIAAETGERDAAAGAVDATILTLYERCRSVAPSGIGAARLIGNTCQGCRLTIPATEVDRVRHSPAGTVAHCDNCGAILVP